MKSLALQDFPFIGLTAAALLLFFVVFAGVVLWTYRPGSRQTYDHVDKLPFE
jgi:cbb3-type cytochrome oxidase subunit 3